MRLLPAILAMAALVVASNILVQFLLWDGFLTWGAFTYPFAFLVTDITNRLYGPAAARRVVLAGFATGILCSLIGTQVMLEFGPAVVLRVAVASGAAFLAAQLLDVAVFNRMRAGRWWRAPLVSTLASSTLDTAVFFTIAFAGFVSLGPEADAATAWARETVPFLGAGAPVPLWHSLAVADWGVKLAIALLALLPFRLIVGQMLQGRRDVTPSA
ncbi:queuosine precursor transporter [Pseudoroseicyclus sp. CXY001]|uniref:queuosine precursor transporter n=1 Tax=Pseudoroseicyclus sp. CXY001 TaxID=3242492 RepID=UPI0035713DE5